MSINGALTQLGLDEKESALYVAALELGAAPAKDIAEKAGIQRTHFYDLSKKLVGIGLLKQIRDGKKHAFVAEEPEKLLELQKERLRNLEKTLPQFKALQNTKNQKPKVFFYEGRKGIDRINEDTLRYQGECVAFTTPRFLTADQENLSREHISKRKALGIPVRVIGEVSPELMSLKERDQAELRKTRMLPQSIFTSEVEIGIYGNRVSFVNYKEEFGFIVEDSDISKALKKIFEIIWSGGMVTE